MSRKNSAKDALEQLIQQFAQPMSFLRELVQNSLDAGTTLVEVNVGHDKPSGQCYIQVKDNGEGMTEEIIDNRLTRLFSSTKENDLTKIGKFGIGFVSIFAVKPDLVVLETGREGEYWRILFKPDRTYEKRQLMEPVEGTSVTLYLPLKRRDLGQLMEDARQTVTYWCKYSHTDIAFNGERINETFGFQEEPYTYHLKTESTEAVLAPDSQSSGFQGFYNRGLTLLEGPGSPIAYLKFRVRSPYLEHTLSRDNIMRDRNFRKVMSQIEKACTESMPDDIFSRLEAGDDPSLWEAAVRALNYPITSKLAQKRAIVPIGEGKVAPVELPAVVAWHPQNDELVEAVEALGEPVLRVDWGSPVLQFLTGLGRLCVPLTHRFFVYEKVAASVSEQALLDLLAERVRHFSSTFLIELRTKIPGSGDLQPLGLYLNPSQQARRIGDSEQQSGDALGLVRDHLLFQKVIRLAQVQPELALGLLVRKLNLDLGLGLKGESKILTDSLSRIRERSEVS